MDKTEVIEALGRPSQAQEKDLEAKVAGLKWEIKKMVIMEKNTKNESENCGEEWSRCYTNFMFQVQGQMDEDWDT